MTTLEDKILGEKTEYYCSSSSEDENENEPTKYKTTELSKWEGVSTNTGPKGVIRDWEKFKQLEKEKRDSDAIKRQEMIQKASMTCRSILDEERVNILETDPEIIELLTDDYMYEYEKQRIKEILDKVKKIHFSNVINLKSTEEFLNAIDEEDKSVTVIIHIYEKNEPGCDAMNGCLITLATEYPLVKFCKILGSVVCVSQHFKKEGVPALLVYKNGQIIGNFIRVTDILGEDFFATDVEKFLTDHGILNCKQNLD